MSNAAEKTLSAVQVRKAEITQEVVRVLRTTEEPLTASQVHAKLTAGGSKDPKWIDVYEACQAVGQPFAGTGRVRYHDLLEACFESEVESPSEPDAEPEVDNASE